MGGIALDLVPTPGAGYDFDWNGAWSFQFDPPNGYEEVIFWNSSKSAFGRRSDAFDGRLPMGYTAFPRKAPIFPLIQN